ncbi:YybH family protein [Flavobacterium sp. XS2P39]|uniref:YybH family protein n=1 Tax=Flavobacterium sp. XS2P39 TaxID=3401725 RepID=UPI003AAC412B
MKKNLNSPKLVPVYITFALFLIVVASCNSSKKDGATTFDLATAKKEIAKRNAVFMNALRERDSVGVAKCYTLNSKFMMPNAKAVVGRENLIPVIRGFIMGGMTNITIKPIEVWGNEDMMTVEQQWEFTDKNGAIIDRGKSLELWKKEDNEWKIFRDCFNSDLPIPKTQ